MGRKKKSSGSLQNPGGWNVRRDKTMERLRVSLEKDLEARLRLRDSEILRYKRDRCMDSRRTIW